MSANLHIAPKSLIWALFVIVLTAALTILGAAASAQKSVEAGGTTRAGITATLLGVPVYGTAPLTVDFYVSIANPREPLVYQWNFGDGIVASLPGGVYVLHVYSHPGTYLCSLNLATARGSSTTLLTTIVVRSSRG